MNRKSTLTYSSLRILVGILLIGFSGTCANASDPVGKWKGEWKSGKTGHRGPMRANIRQQPDGTYKARFTGRFAVIIPFTYQTELQPSIDSDGQLHLRANKPLGPIMGSYSMDSIVSPSSLNGSFRAAKDVGTIQMRRVGGE